MITKIFQIVFNSFWKNQLDQKGTALFASIYFIIPFHKPYVEQKISGAVILLGMCKAFAPCNGNLFLKFQATTDIMPISQNDLKFSMKSQNAMS